MKKRYSEEQIVKILLEGGTEPVASVCRKNGISDVTFYNWRQKYQDMEVSDVRKLRQLEGRTAS